MSDATHLPPRVHPLPQTRERCAWALDALDAVAEARGSRRSERGDSRFDTLYIAAVAVVVLTAMGWSLLSGLVADVCAGATCTGSLGHVEAGALSWVGAAIQVALLGSVVVAARFLGPAGLPAAARSWIASSPAHRAPLLRRPLRTVLAAAAVVGAVGGGAAGAVAAGASGEVPLFLAIAAASAAIAVLVTELVSLAQGRRFARFAVPVGAALVVLGVVGAALVSAVSGLASRPLPMPTTSGALVALGVAVVAALALWPVCSAHLGRLRSAEIRRGGDATEATVTGLLMLESGALVGLYGSHTRERRGRARSRRLRGRGIAAVVSAQIRRLTRGRVPVGVAGATLPCVVLVSALAGQVAATVVAALLAVLVCSMAASGLRLATRSTAIRRMYPWSTTQVRIAHLVAPALLTAVWAAIACLLAGLSPAAWLVCTLIAPAAAVRSAPESSMGIAAAQVSMTPMGAVPVGIFLLLARGPDLAVIPLILLIVHLPSAAVLTSLAILMFVLQRPDAR